MLEAANWAPTHGRTEPWRFVVLSEDALQDMIRLTDQASADLPVLAPQSMLHGPLCLYVCHDRVASSRLSMTWRQHFTVLLLR